MSMRQSTNAGLMAVVAVLAVACGGGGGGGGGGAATVDITLSNSGTAAALLNAPHTALAEQFIVCALRKAGALS
jgi:ABC-type glycerol-3-phosphate transport system substrate-binding protein